MVFMYSCSWTQIRWQHTCICNVLFFEPCLYICCNIVWSSFKKCRTQSWSVLVFLQKFCMHIGYFYSEALKDSLSAVRASPQLLPPLSCCATSLLIVLSTPYIQDSVEATLTTVTVIWLPRSWIHFCITWTSHLNEDWIAFMCSSTSVQFTAKFPCIPTIRVFFAP